MPLNDILVHADSSAKSEKRFKLSLKLAKRHGATLFCLYTQAMPLSLGLSNNKDKRRKLHKSAAQEVFADYQKLADQAGVKLITEISKLPNSEDDVTRQLIQATQHMDLVVISQYHHKTAAGILPHDLAERLVLESGRPALILPYAGEFKDLGKRVLIAWNTGRESVRAVNDAIPLIQDATTVNVIAINPNKGKKRHGEVPAEDIAQHLVRHGINATSEHLTTNDVDAANMLLSCAADESADLLVMGAYGHHRLQELILGGVTRDILKNMAVPVLMSH